jgi:hypothetical protein
MSTGRTLWIIFCCACAAFWFLLGFGTLFITWLFIPLSLLAILVPVGKTRRDGPDGSP